MARKTPYYSSSEDDEPRAAASSSSKGDVASVAQKDGKRPAKRARNAEEDANSNALTLAEIADAVAAHRPPPHDYEDPYQTLRPEDILSSWGIPSDFFRKAPPSPNASLNYRLGAFLARGKIIVTPNADYIPFVYGPDATIEVSLTGECRFGPEDPTLAPSYVRLKADVDKAPHLACIPREPLDTNDPTYVFWADPRDWFFNTSDAFSEMDDLCVLIRKYVQHLEAHIRPLVESANRYLTNCATNRARPYPWAQGLSTVLWHAFGRLASVPNNKDRNYVLAREVQRYWLELKGVMNFVKEIVPLVLHEQPPAASQAPRWWLGAVTQSREDSQVWFQAGVPVWLVRTCDSDVLPNARDGIVVGCPRIERLTRMRDRDQMADTSRSDLLMPVVFRGFAEDVGRLRQVHRYATIQVTYTSLGPQGIQSGDDPLENRPLRASVSSRQRSLAELASPDNPPPAGGQQPAPALYVDTPSPSLIVKTASGISVRNGFDLALLDPQPSPAWEYAELMIKQTKIQRDNKPGDAHRAFPRPTMIFGPADLEKKVQYFQVWCVIRNAVITAARNTDFESDRGVTKISGQGWRNLLCLHITMNSNKTSANSKEMRAVSDLYGRAFDLDIVARTLRRRYSARGISVRPGDLPPADVVKDILWELGELLWRKDVIDLDRRLRLLTLSAAEEFLRLERIFDPRDVVAGDLLVVPGNGREPRGLLSPDPATRMAHLAALVEVMMGWEKPIAEEVLIELTGPVLDEDDLRDVERQVAVFFAESLWRAFGRQLYGPHLRSTVPVL